MIRKRDDDEVAVEDRPLDAVELVPAEPAPDEPGPREPDEERGDEQEAGFDLPEDVSIPRFPAEPGAEDRVRISEVLEALLFASPDSLSVGRLSEAVGVSV